MPLWYVELFLVIMGFCVGSFLNVCIHRWIREESIVRPPSHCPSCHSPIAWYDNIPLISFIALGAKCRQCKAPISFRYFLVELLTGLIFLGSVRFFGLTGEAAASIAFLTLLLGTSAADLEAQIIPDEMSLGGIVLGIAFSVLFPVLHHVQNAWQALGWSVAGALAGGGIIYGTGVLGKLAFRKESMGGGDVKLMAMMGAFLGWKSVILVFFLAPLLALPIGLYVRWKYKEDYIPYGPFLSLAGVLVLFFGQFLMQFFWVNT